MSRLDGPTSRIQTDRGSRSYQYITITISILLLVMATILTIDPNKTSIRTADKVSSGVALPWCTHHATPVVFQQTRVPNSLPMGANYIDYI